MADFIRSVDIDAPPDVVWRTVRDVERWPEWTPTVTSLRLVDPGPLALGSRARIRQPRLPPATWQVTELDGGRGFVWVTQRKGVLWQAE